MEEKASSNAPCTTCGKLAVKDRARRGRFTVFMHLTVEIPEDILVPECSRCKQVYLSNSESLLNGIRRAYLAALKEMAQDALWSLREHISLRQLELLLGLSQGYLSRIKLDLGQPSAPLVALLGLLAESPLLIAVLKDYWAATRWPRLTEEPRPQQ